MTRAVELRFGLPTRVFAHPPSAGWLDNADLLAPDFFDPDTDKLHIASRTG
ncbi:hypothetical protein ACX9NE_23655 [Mycobacterium sp. ML4]